LGHIADAIGEETPLMKTSIVRYGGNSPSLGGGWGEDYEKGLLKKNSPNLSIR